MKHLIPGTPENNKLPAGDQVVIFCLWILIHGIIATALMFFALAYK